MMPRHRWSWSLLLLSACGGDGGTQADANSDGSTATTQTSSGDGSTTSSAMTNGADVTTADAATTSSGAESGTGETGSEDPPLVCDQSCRYVTPSGRGAADGSDWDNALAGLPADLERGRIYLLSDGEYGEHLFADAESGTDVITIRKATETDHGTEVGWVAGDGDAQAVFDAMQIHTDYYSFDGVVRNDDWRTGGVDRYGITTGNVRIDDGNGNGGDVLRFRRVDLHGGGRDTGNGDDVVYGLTGNSDLVFLECAVRDSDRTLFLMRGNWRDLVVDHCYLARNTSTPEVHGEALSMTDSTDVMFSNNAIEDIEGTAVFAALNGGVATRWRIFGNTMTHTADYIADTGRAPGHNFGVSGFVFCANDESNDNTCDDFAVHGNTLVDMQGTWSGVVIQQGTGNVVSNNVWFASERTNNSGVAQASNWYFDTQVDGDDDPASEVCTADCEIFVDRDARDFHLATPTTAGTTLDEPFDTDPDGVPRGGDGVWDRGAFEF
jgi:hypothetical protein